MNSSIPPPLPGAKRSALDWRLKLMTGALLRPWWQYHPQPGQPLLGESAPSKHHRADGVWLLAPAQSRMDQV